VDITSPHLLSAVVVGISTVDLGEDMDADGIELKVGNMLNNFVVSSKVLSKSIRSIPSLWFGDARKTFFKEGKLKVVIVPRAPLVPVRKLENFAQVDVNLLEGSMKSCSCRQGNSPTFIWVQVTDDFKVRGLVNVMLKDIWMVLVVWCPVVIVLVSVTFIEVNKVIGLNKSLPANEWNIIMIRSKGGILQTLGLLVAVHGGGAVRRSWQSCSRHGTKNLAQTVDWADEVGLAWTTT
jgi:hypothetical protein